MFKGIDTKKYAKTLEHFAKEDDFINYKLFAIKYNLEIAKAMAHVNIHHWSHFESCFKYSKSKKKMDRKCRYRKPDWPAVLEYFLCFEIGEDSNIEHMSFNRTQRPPYIYFSESNINLFKYIVCNHCVKLVLTSNLAFYMAGYSTKCAKDTSNSVSRMFKNMHTQIKENEKKRKENDPSLKSLYKIGLKAFNQASNNFEKNSTIGTAMAAFCIIEGSRFKFSEKFAPIIPYQSLQYITHKPVTAVVDDKQNIKLSTTNYIFRNKSLEKVTQYDFVESFEVIPKSRFPKGQHKK